MVNVGQEVKTGPRSKVQGPQAVVESDRAKPEALCRFGDCGHCQNRGQFISDSINTCKVFILT